MYIVLFLQEFEEIVKPEEIEQCDAALTRYTIKTALKKLHALCKTYTGIEVSLLLVLVKIYHSVLCPYIEAKFFQVLYKQNFTYL